jgi:hemerythrin-like domain-containing protein
MSKTLQKSTHNALALLKADHQKVNDLFEQFEKAGDRRTKKRIVKQALEELSIHAAIEEQLFYPAVRAEIKDSHIMEEADEEHHVAKVLVAELETMDGSESHFEAKFSVLAENVRHHIKEEEAEMFPQVKKTGLDLTALGEQLLLRKEELKEQGVPPPAEAVMVARSRGQGDSPAQAAQGELVGTSRRG